MLYEVITGFNPDRDDPSGYYVPVAQRDIRFISLALRASPGVAPRITSYNVCYTKLLRVEYPRELRVEFLYYFGFSFKITVLAITVGLFNMHIKEILA